MDENIKQRLLGAAVILILVLMILPFFRQNRAPELPQVQADNHTENSHQTSVAAINPVQKNAVIAPPTIPTPSSHNLSNNNETAAPASITNTDLIHHLTINDKIINQSIDPIQTSATLQAKDPKNLSSNHIKTTTSTSHTETSKQTTALNENKTASVNKNIRKQAKSFVASHLSKKSGSGTWTVQIGTFNQAKLATQLVDQLKKHQLVSYQTTLHQPQQKIMYRVRVGHQLTRSDAESLREALKNNLHLQAIIVEDHS